jgi:hypothetical protein
VQQVLLLRIIIIDKTRLHIAKNLHKVDGILTHTLLANCEGDQGGTLHCLGSEQSQITLVGLLKHIHQKRHETVVPFPKCRLCRISDSSNGRKSLFLHKALRVLQKRHKVFKESVEIRLKNILLSFLAEVDQSCSGV